MFRLDLALAEGDIPDSCACNIASLSTQGNTVVTAESCRRIRSVLEDYLEGAIDRLKTMNRGLLKLRQSNEERLFSKGTIHPEAKEKFERHVKAFEKLCDSVNMLCEALERTPPHLENATTATGEGQLGIVFDGPPGAARDEEAGQWEDDEERVFYESILDLSSKLPPLMLSSGRPKQPDDGKDYDAPEATTQRGSADAGPSSSTSTAYGSADDENDHVDFELVDENGVDAIMPLEQTRAIEVGNDDDDDDDADDSLNALGMLEYQRFIAQREGEGEPTGDAGPGDTAAFTDSADGTAQPGFSRLSRPSKGVSSASNAPRPESSEKTVSEGTMTVVQQSGPSISATQTLAPLSFADLRRRLPTLMTKVEVDQAAVDFCYVNNRSNRKALVNVLVDAPRRQMFVIPLYSRFIATLHPYFPDIGEGVVEELTRDFGWLVRKRFKGLLDTRLKNVRYIAELTKFKVAPLHVSFRCAKVLLDQFHIQNIEVLCTLLDGCGRFLRAQPQTAARIVSLLEILMRKRRTLNLDDRAMLLIENACNACQLHRSKVVRPVKYRTPYERYIRKLMYEDLSGSAVDVVFLKLRKLPWGNGDANDDDPQRVRHTLLSCFTKIWKIKHSNVGPTAMILEALGHLYPWFRISVVDAVIENIKLGLERNMFDRSQRRISEVHYIGEMLTHGIVGASLVFDLVRMLLKYGHHEPIPLPGRSCEVDTPSDYFRIRLVCTLLSTCGSHIHTGDTGDVKALADILLYFQMYIMAKQQPLPVDIDYNVELLFDTVFAKSKRYGSWDEAAQAMAGLVQHSAQSMTSEQDVNKHNVPPNTSAEVVSASTAGNQSYTSELAVSNAGDSSSSSSSSSSSGEPDSQDGAVSESSDVGSQSGTYDGDEESDVDEARRQMEAVEALLEKEEEEALEREFNKLMLDSSDARKSERAGKLDVGIPMHLLGRAMEHKPALPAENSSDNPSAASGSQDRLAVGESADTPGAIRFSLLTGKKQRPMIHEVDIPTESRMAQNLRQQEEATMREKALLKKIVLSYERREAEEQIREHERELAARRAMAFRTTTPTGPSVASGSTSTRRSAIPGATFVNRPSAAASRKRHHASNVSQQKEQQKTGAAYPGIPDHFL
ncbi:ARM repeat-containing protein [Coemansia reversa NRRL 1564]|uniref:ARM repeat-containing protein n=1 Tax=Coemansia reversa (strain ATCC 12441 / NRRL 1564) TaxID=763665 RepID=A0A2G5B6R0_COERN|nr:ARM repeat-containing protein [Coemansia reversa NRRL 1564]|eukprot:PIA14672.1 ARM repeat-containing protein [Coemansia reversa NRRL 1564]